MREVYGVSRSRDKKGVIVKRNLNPFVNCIHTMVGGGLRNDDCRSNGSRV